MKNIIEKQNQTITTNIMSKFFEIKKSNIEDMTFIFDKKTIILFIKI